MAKTKKETPPPTTQAAVMKALVQARKARIAAGKKSVAAREALDAAERAFQDAQAAENEATQHLENYLNGEAGAEA